MNQALRDPTPLPLDVRLMHIGTALLWLALAVMALGSAAWWALRHSVFAVERITVQGDVMHNNEVTLRANVMPRLVGNFFTIDLKQAQRAFEAVPWVRSAVVRREFPNRLRVTLQEHRSAGLWGLDTESRMINSFGELFEANTGEVEAEDLPRLAGPDAQAQTVLAMYRMLAPLFAAQDATLELLELSDRGLWRAQLDTGGQLELGRGDAPEVGARTRRFLATLTQVASRLGVRSGSNTTGLAAVESADLRHSQGYALRLRGIATANPTTDKTKR